MTSTFYIPKDQEETFRKFIAECKKRDISYSSALVILMEMFNNNSESVVKLFSENPPKK